MPLEQTDDPIHSFRGVWLRIGDKEMFIHWQYVAWVVFFAVAIPTGFAAWGVGFGVVNSVLFIALPAGVATQKWYVRSQSKDLTLRGFLSMSAAGAADWCAARVQAVREAEAREPVRFSLRKVRVQ